MSENYIDVTGVHTQTYDETVDAIINGTAQVPGLKQIYGTDIITDSNSPDGQFVNIFALAKQDILDFLNQDYNSKDPDQAVGVALDAVSQLCGITRQAGSYTVVQVVVTVDRSLTLNGIDGDSLPFTVSDDNGNRFNLLTTTALTVGANTLLFQAEQIGAVEILQNTLTNAVTVVLGVVSVNNPNLPITQGQNQETDAEFRLRRQISVATPSQGTLAGMLGGLYAIEGLVEAVIYQNNTASIDGDSIPGHSVWVIVDGGANADIADVIYRYLNAGCGMKGTVSVTVEQIDGSDYTILFDRVVSQNLYIQFDVESITDAVVDTAALKQYIVDNYDFGIYDSADITAISALVHAYSPDLVVTAAGVSSDGVTYVDFLYPTSKKNKWVTATARIDITVIL